MTLISLGELQTRFAGAVLGHGEELPPELIVADGMPAEARLDVYRNNSLFSLQDALRGTFPVVCRVVHERFFQYLSAEFIRCHPPRRACLAAYGGEFSRFLAGFPACRQLVYLPDLAQLEWLMHLAACAREVPPLQPGTLGTVSPEELPNLGLCLAPSLGYLHSSWPVDLIWRTNRSGSDDPGVICLDMGPVRLEVRRIHDEVVLRALPAGVFEFRAALHRGAPVVAAADAALAADQMCDISAALTDLMQECAIVGLSRHPFHSEGVLHERQCQRS